jgi:Uma2 family endonuclease
MSVLTAEQAAVIRPKTITLREDLVRLMPDASQLLSEEPEMESSLHHKQAVILEKSLERWWKDRNDFFIGVNLTIYFSRQRLKTHDFRGPDVFIVRNTERRERTSWVIWEEDGKYPNVIVELLSDSTEDVDRDLKKEIYQDRFRTPEYFWFSVQTLEFEGWQLNGGWYKPIPSNELGWKWSEQLGLYLGIAEGRLRYYTPDGMLVPTPEEAEEQAVEKAVRAVEEATQAKEEATQAKEEATQAKEEATQAKEEAAQAKERAEQLAARLRALGVDPDAI